MEILQMTLISTEQKKQEHYVVLKGVILGELLIKLEKDILQI